MKSVACCSVFALRGNPEIPLEFAGWELRAAALEKKRSGIGHGDLGNFTSVLARIIADATNLRSYPE